MKKEETKIGIELREEEKKLLCILRFDKVGTSILFTKGFTVKNIDAMDKVVS